MQSASRHANDPRKISTSLPCLVPGSSTQHSRSFPRTGEISTVQFNGYRERSSSVCRRDATDWPLPCSGIFCLFWCLPRISTPFPSSRSGVCLFVAEAHEPHLIPVSTTAVCVAEAPLLAGSVAKVFPDFCLHVIPKKGDSQLMSEILSVIFGKMMLV